MKVDLKKVKNTLVALAAIITASGVIWGFLIWLFLNGTETGQKILGVIEFADEAKTVILPQAQAEHETIEMRLEELEGKHAGTMARVIEWNFNSDAWQLRTFEDNYKRIYPAYISQSSIRRGRWVYLKNGYEYLVYP